MRRWIEEDNRGNVPILGIRWLLKEGRRAGKLASLVIYLKNEVDINHGARMGRRIFRITRHDWERQGWVATFSLV